MLTLKSTGTIDVTESLSIIVSFAPSLLYHFQRTVWGCIQLIFQQLK